MIQRYGIALRSFNGGEEGGLRRLNGDAGYGMLDSERMK